MTSKYAASENSELGQQRDYTITFFHISELGWGEERAIERCSPPLSTSVFLQV